MDNGDPPTSPFVWRAGDYMGRFLTITVPWDDSVGGTRNILDGTTVVRDAGCLWSSIVFDVPIKGNKMPSAPVGTNTFTAQQVRVATGFRTYNDLIAVQITAVA